MATDRGGGERLIFFKGLATGSLTMLSDYMDNTNWTHIYIYMIFGGRSQSGVDMRGVGSKGDQGTLCEIPK